MSGAEIITGHKLAEPLPLFQITNIGSRVDTLFVWNTDKGLIIQTGCFKGTRAEFEDALQSTHADNRHARDYRAALDFIDARLRD